MLEKHSFARCEAHYVLHRVLDGLYEAGGGLGVFVAIFAGDGLLLCRVPMVIVLAAGDAVDVKKAYVEPDGGIKGTALVDAEPGELAVEGFGVLFGGEVAVFSAAVGDCPADSVDELLYGILPSAGLDVTVEVFAGYNLGGELAPRDGDLDIVLLEDYPAFIAGNFGRASLPLKLVKGMNAGSGEEILHFQPR